MDELNILSKRKSIRSYNEKVVPEPIIDYIVAAAQTSPVASGRYENYHITMITDKSVLDAIEKAFSVKIGSDRKPLYDAPAFAIVSVKAHAEEIENAEYATAGMIVHNMVLAAESQGLGACYIWGVLRVIHDNPLVLAKLDLPEGFVPVGGMVFGYTDEGLVKDENKARAFSINYLKAKTETTKDL